MIKAAPSGSYYIHLAFDLPAGSSGHKINIDPSSYLRYYNDHFYIEWEIVDFDFDTLCHKFDTCFDVDSSILMWNPSMTGTVKFKLIKEESGYDEIASVLTLKYIPVTGGSEDMYLIINIT